MLPFVLFYYIQENQTECKVKFWNKPPIAHTSNFITAMHCQIQRKSWLAQGRFYDFVFGGANRAGIFVLGSSRRVKRRRREAAIAEGKKPLPTRGSEGAWLA